jgi:hypothetical protein
MSAPVLLIIYKRPDLTRRALAAIAAAKPPRLFVAADGPRTPADAEACRLTRAAVDELTGIEVVTNFADRNLGCGIRVHTAISWAFESAEELIVIEDDCLPNASFFRFCNELLAAYRDDERVMHVSGDNFVGPAVSGPHSYYFSKYTHAWGWATWKRAWRHFDWTIARWPELKATGMIESWCPDVYEQRYWTVIFDQMFGGAPDVWDYMWMFACWSQNGLAALPSANLVRNDGWGPDATHTHDPVAIPPTENLDRIEHPPYVVRNMRADAITFDHNFGGAHMRAMDTPRARFRRHIDPLLGPARIVKRALKRVAGRN